MSTEQEKVSLNEALESLTNAEIRVIERHFGKEFGDTLHAFSELTPGAIYCLERRNALKESKKPPTWEDIDQLTTRQLKDYFAEDEPELISGEPETAQGKDDSLGK